MPEKTRQGPPSRIVLVDGTNSLYRAFFAIPHLRASDGSPTNAVYGFVNMLNKVIREETPDCVIVVFDARGKTFRHRMFEDYKAGRDAQPEDLSAQIPVVREVVDAYRIPVVEVEDFEADDVIATLVARAPKEAQVAIVSTDRDLMQLVSERVTLLDGVKDRRFGPREVEERFGVPPDRMLDLRALTGDKSDNIPGVKGIGEKGAAKLIGEWHTLENLIEHAPEISARRAREALIEHADDARLSKRLATLRSDVPLPVDYEDALRRDPDDARLRPLFERLGFGRLLAGLDDGSAPDTEEAPVGVETVADTAGLDALVGSLGALPVVALAGVSANGAFGSGEPAGIAFALAADRAAFAPVSAETGLALADVSEALAGLLGRDARVAWSSDDTKSCHRIFAELGLELAVPHFDVTLAGALLDPAGPVTVTTLAAQHLGARLRSWEELAGRGAKARAASELPAEEVAAFAARRACAVRSLEAPLRARLDADGLASLFEEVELPLTRVLARMETAGVRIDEVALEGLSREYEGSLATIEREIYELAGEPFLISSPKQLQTILFEKLKLPALKKTKTGYSTDESVLEQLVAQHALPERILAYRHLAKLKNTYVDALPPLVDERTGRIHPTFHQLGAATGRLSATNPNVQNIPIRTEEGVRIREAFVAAEGHRLMSADYSQVELRILAHYSEDADLIAAFQQGDDIHRRTAAEVLGLEPSAIGADQRSRAKAVNFGIIYGLSAFGLANQLGIASAEAQELIDAYFSRYCGVRSFIDDTIAAAREKGHVTTLLGRRRYLPDLGSRNRTLRQAAERMAVNTVIQGTAADLIKKAMVAVDAALESDGLRARMILQVHDELVFETPEGEAAALEERVRECMEGVLPLRVPLVVDVGLGANWREAH